MYFKETTITKETDYPENKQLQDIWCTRTRSSNIHPPNTSSIDVFYSGRDSSLRNAIINEMNKANEFICICSFLLGEDQINSKILEKSKIIPIYILSVPETILNKDIADQDDNLQAQQKIDDYKRFLNAISEKVLFRASKHFHSKFILIDPKNPNKASGILTTANFNSAVIDGDEIGIKLNYNEIQELYQQFLIGFWEESEMELLQKGTFKPISKKPESITLNYDFKQIWLTIFSEKSRIRFRTLKDRIIKFLDQTEGEIIISMYGFDLDSDLFKKLIELSKKRKIILLTRLRENQLSILRELKVFNITIYGSRKLHAKAIVSTLNGKLTAFLMTANFQKKGLDEGFESGIILNDQRATKINNILKFWIESFEWEYIPQSKLENLQNNFFKLEAGVFVEHTIKLIHEFNTRDIYLTSLDQKVELNVNPEPNIYAKKFKQNFKIIPNRLPAGLEKIDRKKIKCRIYVNEKGDKYYLGANNSNEYEEAINLKSNEFFNAIIGLD